MKEKLLELLQKIRHPEAGGDIVESGMLESISIEEKNITLQIRYKRPNDPLASSIRRNSIQIIHNAYPEYTVDVKSVFPEPKAKEEPLQKVKFILAVASGKGGVGKSTIASNLAVSLAKRGFKTGLLDADLYGPSAPVMFGIGDTPPRIRKENEQEWIEPIEKFGVKILSIGFFVQPEQAMIWRGPMATSTLKQLIEQGEWGELDFLILDMPPGTGDIHLTMVQTIPVSGAIIVTTPQNIALADAVRGAAMFRNPQIDVPVLGIVENMAWFTPSELPENKYYIFGKDGGKTFAETNHLEFLGQIPLVMGVCDSGDAGIPIVLNNSHPASPYFEKLTDNILAAVEKRKEQMPTKKVNIQSS
jgi:ATP-binding protein involved in chromosome partitioning